MDVTAVVCMGYMLICSVFCCRTWNFIPHMWQVEFTDGLIEDVAVDSYVDRFFGCSSSVLPLPSYNLKVLHRCSVACKVLMFIYGR